MSAPGGTASRFTAPNQSTEQRLATNVVGLVELSDFRKRRAEALEQQEREAAQRGAPTPTEGTTGDEASGRESGRESGDGDSNSNGNGNASRAGSEPAKKKKKTKDAKKKSKGKVNKLSFGDEDEEEEGEGEGEGKDGAGREKETPRREPKESKAAVPAIKSFTQQALRKQAAEREALRKEFLLLQAAVRATEVAIPFVFYEGANIPGGVVRVKKGDPVWLMLDRSRKVGARLGEKQEVQKSDAATTTSDPAHNGADAQNQHKNQPRPSKARMHWARINVDDLMLVRGNLIIPHHYDFYFFVINKTIGPGGERVFAYSNEAPGKLAAAGSGGLSTPGSNDKPASESTSMSASDYAHLEGADDDPTMTKVVDRRWYERNKHIYPASLWQDFDPDVDYTHQVRRDHGGNAFFFAPK